jgi:hypothetical protein
LLQSAYFRVHNRDDAISNLYFVGAGTHPGAGIPGVVGECEGDGEADAGGGVSPIILALLISGPSQGDYLCNYAKIPGGPGRPPFMKRTIGEAASSSGCRREPSCIPATNTGTRREPNGGTKFTSTTFDTLVLD